MTTDILKFDDARLIETAKAVCAINPHAMHDPVSMAEYMKSTARRAFADGSGGYISTNGFVLTLFINPGGEREVYSSVLSYSVNEYVKRMGMGS